MASRAPLHRWMTGGAKRLPYPDHCRIRSAQEDVAHDVGRRLVALQRTLRLSDDETRLLASLSGHVVELVTTVAITIGPEGDALVTYTHEVLNLTSAPLRRVPREIWFKHTSGSPLTISPIPLDGRRLMIQRTHDAATMSKFACQFAPAVEPGEVARFGYSCTGGRFVDEFYWRQAVPRHTRHLTITVKHEGATLLRCTAIEELQDGSEVFATDELLWDYEGSDVSMTVTRDYLQPNQALTLRWEIERAVTPA